MNSRLINSVAVILDPITTLFSVLFVSLFVKTFGLEQYGYFILLIAWFSLALNNSWGFDNAARSLLSQAHTGDQKLESLYLVCIYTGIAASGLFIIINRVTGYFDYYETLFILSAFAQLTTAIAGPIYLQNDNIIAERVLYSTFNNINILSLLLCLTISNEINTFFALRFGLILTAVTAIHFLFCRKIFQKNVVSNAHKELFSTIIKVSKYSINNLSAGVIWQLNPLILSTVATPNMIAAFGLYFRIAGLIISCQGYIFSWSVVHLKNNVMASSTQKVLAIIKIYTVVVPIALTSFVFYVFTSGYLIEYWIGENINLPRIEVLALGVWMGLMIILSPLTSMVNIFDRVDGVWIVSGLVSAILHCCLIYIFAITLGLPLIAFPIAVLLIPIPITLYYVYQIITNSFPINPRSIND